MSNVLRVRCVVCGEVLIYTPENTGPLLQHLRSKHPCLSVACLRNNEDIQISDDKDSRSSLSYSTNLNSAQPHIKTQQNLMMEPGDDEQADDPSTPSEGYGEQDTKKRGEGNQKDKGRTVFSTTVEFWRPGSPPILCYNCGNNSQPIQRRSLKKSSYSSLGALCLLGCWPSCFLPFLTCTKRDTVNLYCAQCNAFLGTLDQKSKVVTKSPKPKTNDPS